VLKREAKEVLENEEKALQELHQGTMDSRKVVVCDNGTGVLLFSLAPFALDWNGSCKIR